MENRGGLSRNRLSEIIQDLAAQKYWGILRVRDATAWKEFDFASGGVKVTSIGDRKAPPIGQILMRVAGIKKADLEKALETQKDRPGYLGEILVSMRLVTEDAVLGAVREQALTELSDLYFWASARYEYASGQSRPRSAEFDQKKREAGVKSLSYTGSLGQLLGDAKNAYMEFEKIQRELGSGETTYEFTPSARDMLYKKGGFQRLIESDQRVAVLLDGKKSVSEILSKVPLHWAETMRILHRLLKAGAIERV